MPLRSEAAPPLFRIISGRLFKPFAWLGRHIITALVSLLVVFQILTWFEIRALHNSGSACTESRPCHVTIDNATKGGRTTRSTR
jgi:hypothetical protein